MPDNPEHQEGATPDGDEPQDDAPQPERDVTAEPSSDDSDARGQEDDGATPESTDDVKRLMKALENERSETKRESRERKQLEGQLSELQEKLDAIEREKMSEEEKREADFQKTQEERDAERQRANELERKTRDMAADNALLSELGSDPERKIVHLKSALKLIDRSGLEFDDDGTPNAESVTKAVNAMVEENPFIVEQPRPDSGSPTNPERGQAGDGKPTYSDRRDRIYGAGNDPFSDEGTRVTGGGVRYFGEDSRPARP